MPVTEIDTMTATPPSVSDAPDASSAPPDAPAAPEAPEAPSAAPEGKKDTLAPKFGALSRKHREMVSLQRSVSEREKALAAKEAELKAYEQAKQVAKQDPDAWIKAQGFKDFEDYARHYIAVMNDPDANKGPSETEQKLNSVVEKVAAYEKAEAERARARREADLAAGKQAALASVKTYLTAESFKLPDGSVSNNKEKFELINAYNCIDDVWEVIESTYIQSKGKVHVTIEQAAQRIEDELIAEAKQRREIEARTKKLNPPKSAPVAKQELTKTERATPKPSLTHNASLTRPSPSEGQVSDAELDRRALLILQRSKRS